MILSIEVDQDTRTGVPPTSATLGGASPCAGRCSAVGTPSAAWDLKGPLGQPGGLCSCRALPGSPPAGDPRPSDNRTCWATTRGGRTTRRSRCGSLASGSCRGRSRGCSWAQTVAPSASRPRCCCSAPASFAGAGLAQAARPASRTKYSRTDQGPPRRAALGVQRGSSLLPRQPHAVLPCRLGGVERAVGAGDQILRSALTREHRHADADRRVDFGWNRLPTQSLVSADRV